MMPLFHDGCAPQVVALTSDRGADFTLSADFGALNVVQRRYLHKQLAFDVPDPVSVRQVHGDRVVIVDEQELCRPALSREADGLITTLARVPLAIRTADCLPVFLWDLRRPCIGIVHAGWRGSQKNIIAQAVGLMVSRWGSDPDDIRAVFGPAIRSCCYEVGGEFTKIFPMETAQRFGRNYLDLARVNRNQLAACGIAEKQISDSGICTCCDSNYFSYRRQGSAAGRMISVIVLKEVA